MRQASLLPALTLALALCAVAPLAFAQSAETTSTRAPATAATDIAADPAGDPPRTQKSAFGRVMGLMTQLLQEASTRPADADAPGLITSFENAGIDVRVTPVDASNDDAKLAVQPAGRDKAPSTPR